MSILRGMITQIPNAMGIFINLFLFLLNFDDFIIALNMNCYKWIPIF